MAYRHVFIPIRGWFVGIGTSLLVVALHFAGIGVRLPLTIFATAVIFPLAFTIAEAFRRREFCLDRLGSITGGLRTMHVNICGLPSTTTKWERDLQDLALGLIEFLSFELAAPETESERHRRSVDIHLARMARWMHGMKVEAAEILASQGTWMSSSPPSSPPWRISDSSDSIEHRRSYVLSPSSGRWDSPPSRA